VDLSGQFSNNERIVEIARDAHAKPGIALIHYTGDDIPDGPVLAAFAGNHALPVHLLDVIWKGLSYLTTEKVLRFFQQVSAYNILTHFISVHIILPLK
jgi:hypothetical protein